MKNKTLSLYVASALALGATSAQAVPLSSIIVADGSTNLFADQSLESYIDVDGDGVVSNGDVAVGLLRLDDRSSPTPLSLSPTDAVAAFSVTIANLDAAGRFDAVETTLAPFTLQSLLGLGAQPAGGIAAVYSDVPLDYINQSPGDVNLDGQIDFIDFLDSIAGVTNAGTGGTRELIVGLGSGATQADDFFQNELGNLGGGYANLNSFPQAGGLNFSSFTAGLSVLENNTGLDILENTGVFDFDVNFSIHDIAISNGDQTGLAPALPTCTPVTNGAAFFGNGGAAAATCANWFSNTGTVAATTGGQVYEFYGVSDNADVALAAIPEPGTLGLLAGGLLAGAGASRRRRSARP